MQEGQRERCFERTGLVAGLRWQVVSASAGAHRSIAATTTTTNDGSLFSADVERVDLQVVVRL